jgi:hypothetical protein
MSSRKYNQPGYQSSDGRESASRRPVGQRAPEEGPRGRGFGKPTATVFRCAVCGTQQALGEIPGEEPCTHCGTDLHTCTHCTFFDTSVHRECRKEGTEMVTSKAKRNACTAFAPRVTQENSRESERTPDAKSAFDALFDL